MIPPPSSIRRVIGLTAAALAAALVGPTFSTPARAETPRAELGKRLRRFEIAWQEADGERRAAAVGPMTAAVRSFFTLKLSAAASHLDEAWFTVRSREARKTAERVAIATAVTATPLLADTTAESLAVTFAPFYETEHDAAGVAPGRLRLSILDGAGETLADRPSDWAEATGTIQWQTGPLPEGDLTLVVERLSEAPPIEIARIGLSRVERLRDRLAAQRGHVGLDHVAVVDEPAQHAHVVGPERGRGPGPAERGAARAAARAPRVRSRCKRKGAAG
jgi:hypothetical protein